MSSPVNRLHATLIKHNALAEWMTAWDHYYRRRPIQAILAEHGEMFSATTVYRQGKVLREHYMDREYGAHDCCGGKMGQEFLRLISSDHSNSNQYYQKSATTHQPHPHNVGHAENGAALFHALDTTVTRQGDDSLTVTKDGGTMVVDGQPPLKKGERINKEKFATMFGLNPEDIHITSCSMRKSNWQQQMKGGKVTDLHAYKYNINFTWATHQLDIMSDDSWLPDTICYDPIPVSRTPGEEPMVIGIGDTHVGKAAEESGWDLATFGHAWGTLITNLVREVQERNPNHIYLMALGDFTEGHTSQVGKNIAGLGLPLSEQIHLASRLYWQLIHTLARTGKPITVAALGGNHGDMTRVQNMPVNDNTDILIMKMVADRCSDSHQNVHFVFPELNNAFIHLDRDTHGINMLLAHGHTWKGGFTGAQKVWDNLRATGGVPFDTKIMMFGHFHHFQASMIGADRVMMSIPPSGELRSQWFTNAAGVSAGAPGCLVFTVNDNDLPTKMSLVGME